MKTHKDDSLTLGEMSQDTVKSIFQKIREIEESQQFEQSEEESEFSKQLDDSFLITNIKEISAVLASTPPEPAVIEQVVTTTTQGATIEYMPVLSFLYHENDLPYHSLEAVINIMRTKGLLISLPESSQSSLVQPTDSFFDPLPLSAYADLERVGG